MPLGRWIAIMNNDKTVIWQKFERAADVLFNLTGQVQSINKNHIKPGFGTEQRAAFNFSKEVITGQFKIDRVFFKLDAGVNAVLCLVMSRLIHARRIDFLKDSFSTSGLRNE